MISNFRTKLVDKLLERIHIIKKWTENKTQISARQASREGYK
jgi:hypothetical protein